MAENEEEIKTALHEYLEAVEKVKKLIQYEQMGFDNGEENSRQKMEFLREVLKAEVEAKKKYFSFVFSRMSWSQKEIDEWMEKNI